MLSNDTRNCSVISAIASVLIDAFETKGLGRTKPEIHIDFQVCARIEHPLWAKGLEQRVPPQTKGLEVDGCSSLHEPKA